MKYSKKRRVLVGYLCSVLSVGILFSSTTLSQTTQASNSSSNDSSMEKAVDTQSAANNSSDEDELIDHWVPKDVQHLKSRAFKKMANTLMPLSPSEIHRLREIYNAVQRASADTGTPPPKPTAVSRMVNLAPGAAPPIARLSSGFITSVVFLDSTGAPWPIKAYDLGDPSHFNIQWDKKGNTLLIQAVTAYKRANLAVMLQGLNTPIMLTLLPGQRAVDYRIDMQVPRVGPNAQMSNLIDMPSGADPRLLDVLNGIPPSNSKALEVQGGQGEAWVIKEHLFLRTPLTVISPGWLGKMSSSDGVIHAYLLPSVPVILALHNGRMVRLTMKGL